jgi:hypothetical protein
MVDNKNSTKPQSMASTENAMNWGSDNDPFEEFEFKPLTEGLGFHAKNQNQKKSIDSELVMGTTTKFTTEKKSISTPSGINSGSNGLNKVEFKTSNLNFENSGTGVTTKSPLQSPLPRPTNAKTQNLPRRSAHNYIPMIEDDSIAKAQTAVNDILKNLNHKKQQEDIIAKTKKRLTWKDATPSVVAAGLDGMLIVAGFLIALIAMLSITKIDLLVNLSNPDQNHSLWLATAFLFAAVHMIYMVVFRAYLGYTPGEWAFDQRCGTETQQASYAYIFKVMLRSMIITMTGFLPITLISALMGKDLLAGVTGTQIQMQTYTQLHA